MDFTQQTTWENRAVVRTKPRLIFDETQTGYFYPLSR